MTRDRDDLDRLRARALEGGRRVAPEPRSGGTPAFLGKVQTSGASAGKFLLLNPTTVFGAEGEGQAATLTTDSTQSVPAYLVRGAPVAGDSLVARHVDHRWVVEMGGYPNLPCAPCHIPKRDLLLTLDDASQPSGQRLVPLRYTTTDPLYGTAWVSDCYLYAPPPAFPPQSFKFWAACIGGGVNVVGYIFPSPNCDATLGQICLGTACFGAGIQWGVHDYTCDPFYFHLITQTLNYFGPNIYLTVL